ncbi:hypothetical protein ONE63_011035 [Megalurothrips usitatus]|uniref:Cuticle protein 16.5-like n=1 Tax=Megalurothrips usitatus TaxID=439358 RepID=A0AAV7XJ53_9NEOP|nr:hypothetical protein ONE63_011035 [Megalurothrips usitatus]
MKTAVVVALFAVLAVTGTVAQSYSPRRFVRSVTEPPRAPLVQAPLAAARAARSADLKGAEATYVATPYVAAYPAVSSYYAAAAVPAVSTYSAYSAVPAVGYAAPAYTAYAASPYYY